MLLGEDLDKDIVESVSATRGTTVGGGGGGEEAGTGEADRNENDDEDDEEHEVEERGEPTADEQFEELEDVVGVFGDVDSDDEDPCGWLFVILVSAAPVATALLKLLIPGCFSPTLLGCFFLPLKLPLCC